MNHISVNRLIEKRIGAVDELTASVVGVGAWCSLHAEHSDAIIEAICNRISSESVSSSVKAALLYVVHEMVLSCAVEACSEVGKRALTAAIARHIPPLVAKIGPGPSLVEFHAAVLKVVDWWGSLKLIHTVHLNEMRSAVGRSKSTLTDSKSVPVCLRPIAKIVSKYETSKHRLRKLESDESSDKGDLAAAKEELSRRIVLVIKALGGDNDADDSPGGLLGQLQEELASLKNEDTDSLGQAKEGDVLGSFF